MSTEKKKCPMCAEEIEAEAKICRFCGTEFEVTTRGYCTNCHDITEADGNGKCPKCGTEVMDRQVESRMKEKHVPDVSAPVPTPAAPAAPVIAAPVPPAPDQASQGSIEIFERKGEDPVVRWLASWFDQIIIGLITIPIILLAALLFLGGINELADPSSLPAFFFLLLLLALFLVWLMYFSIQEGVFGTTLGKVVGAFPLRLKVIRKDGSKVGFGRALLRALIGFFETNLIGAIVIWSTHLHQRLGDLAAGTLVVDATKIRRAAFFPGYAVIEFVDGTSKELVRVIKGVITKWLGVPQWMNVNGIGRDGKFVRLRAKITKGATVFTTESKIGQLRNALEGTFQFRFKEVLEWWRIALIAGVLPLVAVCLVLGLGLGSIIPSFENLPDLFAAEPKPVTFDSLHIYPTGTRVSIEGHLYLPSHVSCDNECGVCLSRDRNGSCDLPIFIRVDNNTPASPNRMDPLPSTYDIYDFWVTSNSGNRLEIWDAVRITGTICETTLGNQCINRITEILYSP